MVNPGVAKRFRGRGVSLRVAIVLIFLIGAFFSVVSVISQREAMSLYEEQQKAALDNADCQNCIQRIQEAVQTLSTRAQSFAINGSAEDAILYFNETQVNRSVETAVERLMTYPLDNQMMKQLNTLLLLNDKLRECQCYSMRLAVEAGGEPSDLYPDELLAVALTEGDRLLSAQVQRDRAREMLFDIDYNHLKSQVDIRISLCRTSLLAMMEERQKSCSIRLEGIMRREQRLVILMMVSLLGMGAMVLLMVLYPVSRMISGIREGKSLKVRGASEIRFLTDTYNQMHGRMEEANARLSYEASHDALTGLFNRSGYEHLEQECEDSPHALIIADVDLFKKINDTWGHDIGDRVLVRVAHTLRSAFREADRVCRIGGDEFAVIMAGAASDRAPVLRRKIAAVAERLIQEEDGLPPVTLSVGVAFSDQLQGAETLYKNADRALYHVKKNGRNGVAFHPEEE